MEVENVMAEVDSLPDLNDSVDRVERTFYVPKGFSYKNLFAKVNFNKKDFYEAIQPVTDHYRGITDSGHPHRYTPPLLDISKRWETDPIDSTDEPGYDSATFLKHVDAVDDLFTLLYSFKGVLDRYPPNSDYSTPGLKTTFELLWGEVWAYYVTIPRVTFSWVYHDILHCIKEATGKDWTVYIEGEEGEELGLLPPPPPITDLPLSAQESIDSGSPTAVPRGVEGEGIMGFIDGNEDNSMWVKKVDSLTPDQLEVLQEALEQIVPKKDIPKSVKSKETFPEKSEVENENKLKELIDKAKKEIPDLRPLNEWSDALKAYTRKGTQHDHPLKKMILFRFMKIHKLPDVFPEDQELLVSYYYQALIATNYNGFFEVVYTIEKLRAAANEIRYRIRQFGKTEIPAIYYLFKDNRFDVDYNFIPTVSDAGKIEVFIKEYFPSYVKMLIGGVKITNIDDSWKVFKGVYTHFQSQKIQKDMNDKIEKAEPRLIIDELTTLIEGPKPLGPI